MIFLQLLLLALGLAAIYVQARIARVRGCADTCAENRAHIDKALAQLREAAQTTPEPNPLSGMNLSKRTQAVRLLRRGEDVGHIAAAMGVPRGEVELLVRVQLCL